MTLLLSGVGAAVGSLFPGGTYAGFMIGSFIGGLFDQPKAPDIGKLTDRRISGSSYGANIARFWGKARLSGNIIWVAEDAKGNHLKEHTKSVGGKKGGGKQKWYSATWAMVFAQGTLFMPDASQADGGDLVHRSPTLKRVWFGDILVYDSSAAKNVVTPTFYAGTESQSPNSTIIASMGVASGDAPAYRGLVYLVFNDSDLRKYGNTIPSISAEFETATVTVGDIFSDLARSTGILPSQLDVSAATDVVTGFVILNQGSPQAEMQSLLEAYSYDAVEADGVIKLVKRGGAVAVTILPEDLGMSASASARRVTRKNRLSTELPGCVTVQFIDAGNSYQTGTEQELWPINPSSNTETLYFPLVLTSNEGRDLAARRMDARRTEDTDFELFLGPKFHKYIPSDIAILPTDTGNVRIRFTSMALGAEGEIIAQAVQDESSVVTQSTTGGGGVTPPDTYEPVPAIFDAWSGKEVRDEDQTSVGFYVAAGSDPVATGDWGGGVVYYSLDSEASWIEGPIISGTSVFGLSTTALSDSGAVAGAFDNTNTVAVDLSAILGTLTAASDSQISGGENIAVLGNEIVGFGTPTLGTPSNYTLSHILRGLRASTMSGHSIGDRFVLVSDDIVRISLDESYVGYTVKVRVLAEGQDLADVASVDVVIAPRTLTDNETTINASKYTDGDMTLLEDQSTLTTGSWTALNVSSWVPSGAVAVNIYSEAFAETSGDSFAWEFRKDSGSTVFPGAKVGPIEGVQDVDTSGLYTRVPVRYSGGSRYIDYRANVTGASFLCGISYAGHWGG